jgi:hypothetical protein
VKELKRTIEDVARGLYSAENSGSPIVGISKDEARQLIEAAQLAPLLQERCELLGRAVNAMWELVGAEDQQAIAAMLDPTGTGQPIPAGTLILMIERKGAAKEGGA